jgi:lipopolysaccharide export system permease protein
MLRLNSYLLKQFLLAAIVAAVAGSLVILFIQSFRFLSLVIENSSTFRLFLQLMILTVPTFMSIVLPIGLAVAILFIYQKLSLDSEIVVMRAAGVSPFRIALPAVLAAVLLALIAYSMTIWVSPMANRELVRMQYEIKNNYSTFLLRPGMFNDVTDGLTFYARSRNSEGQLRGILVHDVRKPLRPVTIMAESGQVVMTNNVPQILIFNGKRQELDTETGRIQQLEFDRYIFDLALIQSKNQDERWPDIRERSTLDLVVPNLDMQQYYVREDGTRDLQPYGELHNRLATPLLVISYTFICIAAMLSGQFKRRSFGRRITIAVIIMVVMQGFVVSLTNTLGKDPSLTPLLYAVILLPLPITFYLLRKGIKKPQGAGT